MPLPTNKLTGHTLVLNVEKGTRYSTFGFWLTARKHIGVVPEQADHEGIQRAIDSGLLLDVTNAAAGIQTPTGSILTPVNKGPEDPMMRAYVVYEGSVPIIVSPSSPEEAASWKFQMENTGTIALPPLPPAPALEKQEDSAPLPEDAEPGVQAAV